MKVIEGDFGKKGNLSAVEVFDSVRKTENLKEYEEAFCFARSNETMVIASNIDAEGLYFLLDQIKLTLLTNGDYEP